MVNDGWGDIVWQPMDGLRHEWFLPRPDEEMPGLYPGVIVRPSYRDWSWTEHNQDGRIDRLNPDGTAHVCWADGTAYDLPLRYLYRIWGPDDPTDYGAEP